MDGDCTACGLPVRLHYRGRAMLGCRAAAVASQPVDRGRLFQLKLHKNHGSRQDALKSIGVNPRGGFRVRIGGRIRGQWVQTKTRDEAEQLVHTYYNEAMFQWVNKGNKGEVTR